MKTRRKQLIAQLDLAIKQYVCLRDQSTCQHCGKPVEGKSCQASHVIPRSRGFALRWHPANVKILCGYCHISWWHKNPLEAQSWFEKLFPDRYAYCMQHAHDLVKLTDAMLEQKLKDLHNMIQNALD